MRDLLICRICLATDIKLFNLHQYKLVESYEILTQTKVSNCDRLPQHICSYCSTLLLKSAQFKRKCNKTQDLLKFSLTQKDMPALNYLNTVDRVKQNLVLPYKTVTTNNVDITVGIRLDCKIKDEIEDEEDEDEVVDDFDKSVNTEDSLNELSPIDQENTGLFETNTQYDTESKEYEIVDSKSDIEVIVLSKDEQFKDSSRGSLVNIQRTRVIERPYACTECPKRFKRPDLLQGHLRAHIGERPFKCPECPKAFTLAFLLRRHRMIHLRERPFKCTECQKAFTSLSLLRKHSLGQPRKLTGERLFTCTECPRAFSLESSLKRHSWVHTGGKPYECELCEKSFAQYRSCKHHHLTVHMNQPSPYKQKSKKPKIDFENETNTYEDVKYEESGETKESEVMDEAVKHIEINKREKDKKDQDQVIKYEIVYPKLEDEDSKTNNQNAKVKLEEDVTIKEEDVDHHHNNYMEEIATSTGAAKDNNVLNVFLNKDNLKRINKDESQMEQTVLVGENEVALVNRRSPPKRTYSGKLKKSKECLQNSANEMISLKEDEKLFSQQNNDVAVKIEKPEEMETAKAAQCNMALIKVEKEVRKKIILNETL